MLRKSYTTRRGRKSPVAFNATPLVDMIFTLSIFFMLVTRFSSAEQVPMQLPHPEHSQAETVKLPARVVINCRPGTPESSGAIPALYSVGPNRPESLSVIGERLASLKRQSPGIQVVLRADKRLSYADVRAVMGVIAEQEIEILNVVAHVGEREE